MIGGAILIFLGWLLFIIVTGKAELNKPAENPVLVPSPGSSNTTKSDMCVKITTSTMVNYCETNQEKKSNPCSEELTDFCCDCNCTYCGPKHFCDKYAPFPIKTADGSMQNHCNTCKNSAQHPGPVCEHYYSSSSRSCDGYIELFVQGKDGFTIISGRHTSNYYKPGDVVFDDCLPYGTKIGIKSSKIKNPWVGSVFSSTKKGGSEFPMNCTNCDYSNDTYAAFAVSGGYNTRENSNIFDHVQHNGTTCWNGKICTLQQSIEPYCDSNHDGKSNPCSSDFSDYCCDCECTYCGPKDYCEKYSPFKKNCRSCKPVPMKVCKNYFSKTACTSLTPAKSPTINSTGKDATANAKTTTVSSVAIVAIVSLIFF